jgi:hypothetical protein
MQQPAETHYYQEVIPAAHSSFFTGDNVTVMASLTIIAIAIIAIIIIVHALDRGKENAITIAQIEADAKVKVAQLEADADIKIAELEGLAQTRTAELGAGVQPTSESEG